MKWRKTSSNRFASDQHMIISWDIPFLEWFVRLTDEQKDELAVLNMSWRLDSKVEGIICDWIEDHGGDREWWHVFMIYRADT